MSKRKQQERVANAKMSAREKKEALKAEKIVKWIFWVLVLCAMCFIGYSIWLTM